MNKFFKGLIWGAIMVAPFWSAFVFLFGWAPIITGLALIVISGTIQVTIEFWPQIKRALFS